MGCWLDIQDCLHVRTLRALAWLVWFLALPLVAPALSVVVVLLLVLLPVFVVVFPYPQ